MNINKTFKNKTFYTVILLLALISSNYSYSAGLSRKPQYSSSGPGLQLKITKNGFEKTYHGWRAGIRSVPLLAGVSILLGGAFLGVGIATTATGVAITAVPAAIFYAGYKGLSSY